MTQLIKLDGKFYDEEDIEELLRLRALLSHPGARAWLEALPGLLELGEKAARGPWEVETDGSPQEVFFEGVVVYVEGFVSGPESAADASLIVALRNALHAATEAGEGKPKSAGREKLSTKMPSWENPTTIAGVQPPTMGGKCKAQEGGGE